MEAPPLWAGLFYMVCHHPINLGGRTYPCGRCIACRLQRTNVWSMRMMHELQYYESACFITLTYNDAHLPVELMPKHLQDFFKRLRYNIDGRKIKYFAAGEYGENYGRPHYHSIVFGISVKEKQLIEDAWNFGFVQIGSVTEQSCKYVASYLIGAEEAIESSKWTGPKQAPFLRCSQGLGKRWVIDNKQQVLQSMSVKVKGKERGIPRYYTKVLQNEITDDMANNKTFDRAEERRLKLEQIGVTTLGRADYDRAYRQQSIEESKTINERRLARKKF